AHGLKVSRGDEVPVDVHLLVLSLCIAWNRDVAGFGTAAERTNQRETGGPYGRQRGEPLLYPLIESWKLLGLVASKARVDISYKYAFGLETQVLGQQLVQRPEQESGAE